MKEPKFKIGDVVMLNSGGPKMTVFLHRGDSHVLCVYFKEDIFMSPEKVDFPNEVLHLVKAD